MTDGHAGRKFLKVARPTGSYVLEHADWQWCRTRSKRPPLGLHVSSKNAVSSIRWMINIECHPRTKITSFWPVTTLVLLRVVSGKLFELSRWVSGVKMFNTAIQTGVRPPQREKTWRRRLKNKGEYWIVVLWTLYSSLSQQMLKTFVQLSRSECSLV